MRVAMRKNAIGPTGAKQKVANKYFPSEEDDDDD
jgi:hypothetical protein